jgi:hypothetical protein
MEKLQKPNDSKDLVYNVVIDMNRPVDRLPMKEKDNSEYESAENFDEEASK